ncbi:MAG: hypothetical protein V1776_04675 [Candidatus Diapherotrites archaeon]
MRKMILILVSLMFFLLGCLSPEQRAQQYAAQGIVNQLNQVNSQIDFFKINDIQCMQNNCITDCINVSQDPDQSSKIFWCKFECSIDPNKNQDWATKYPQCELAKKGGIRDKPIYNPKPIFGN